MANLLENSIYGIDTVSENRKHMPSHDWQACQTLTATKWMEKKSVTLLSKYHDRRVVRNIERRVKGSS